MIFGYVCSEKSSELEAASVSFDAAPVSELWAASVWNLHISL